LPIVGYQPRRTFWAKMDGGVVGIQIGSFKFEISSTALPRGAAAVAFAIS